MFIELHNWFLEFIGGPSGYIGLFLFGIIANTAAPLSPEIMAVAAWKLGMSPFLSIAILTVGNYLGNSLHYYIGFYGGRWFIDKLFKISPAEKQRAEKIFAKFGPPVLLFAWFPIVGDALTLVAGALKYNFSKFTLYSVAGNLFHYLVIFWFVKTWL